MGLFTVRVNSPCPSDVQVKKSTRTPRNPNTSKGLRKACPSVRVKTNIPLLLCTCTALNNASHTLNIEIHSDTRTVNSRTYIY